jgi:hypothetical protein
MSTNTVTIIVTGILAIIGSMTLGYGMVKFWFFLSIVQHDEKTNPIIRKLLKPIDLLVVYEPPAKNYKKKIQDLTRNLSVASSEVDNIVKEMTAVSQERELAVNKLEKKIDELSSREQVLKTKIKDLEQIPLPVAEHFNKLLEKGEKGSAFRDYFLFFMGVIISIAITIVFRLLGF